jgi:hypothetical protein
LGRRKYTTEKAKPESTLSRVFRWKYGRDYAVLASAKRG